MYLWYISIYHIIFIFLPPPLCDDKICIKKYAAVKLKFFNSLNHNYCYQFQSLCINTWKIQKNTFWPRFGGLLWKPDSESWSKIILFFLWLNIRHKSRKTVFDFFRYPVLVLGHQRVHTRWVVLSTVLTPARDSSLNPGGTQLSHQRTTRITLYHR